MLKINLTTTSLSLVGQILQKKDNMAKRNECIFSGRDGFSIYIFFFLFFLFITPFLTSIFFSFNFHYFVVISFSSFRSITQKTRYTLHLSLITLFFVFARLLVCEMNASCSKGIGTMYLVTIDHLHHGYKNT